MEIFSRYLILLPQYNYFTAVWQEAGRPLLPQFIFTQRYPTEQRRQRLLLAALLFHCVRCGKLFKLGYHRRVVFLCIMLTDDENRFLEYWTLNRKKSRNIFNGLAYGLPLGLLMTFTLVLNLASGWHKRATMLFNADPSLILVLLIAIIGIIVFIAVYSVKHKWDMNEQRYRELMAKKNSKDNNPPA